MFLTARLDFPSVTDFSPIRAKYGLRRVPGLILQLAGALDALLAEHPASPDFGLIFLSHFGPMGETAALSRDFLDYPPDQISPGHFANSVFNAPVSYLAKAFGTHGPALSLAGFRRAEESAVLTAQCWLDSGFCCDAVLIRTDEHIPETESMGAALYPVSELFLLSAGGPGRPVTAEELIREAKHV